MSRKGPGITHRRRDDRAGLLHVFSLTLTLDGGDNLEIIWRVARVVRSALLVRRSVAACLNSRFIITAWKVIRVCKNLLLDLRSKSINENHLMRLARHLRFKHHRAQASCE